MRGGNLKKKGWRGVGGSVSCFYFWGTPYTWAYAMLSCIVILPFYCIAEPCIKRMSTDIVWLKIIALACAAKKTAFADLRC